MELFILSICFASFACQSDKYIAFEIDDTEKADQQSDDDSVSDSETEKNVDSSSTCGVPDFFRWNSSEEIISPAKGDIALKDPSVLYHDGKWHIYATTRSENGDWGMTYINFTDWADAGEAPRTKISVNPNIAGYKVSPQLFYFSPDKLWYLIYQTQEPAYSTSTDPSDVYSWSATKRFMPMPGIIENSDTGGIDYWVICDDNDCYLFFTACNGILYRARTTRDDFPDGFAGTTEIVLEDDTYNIFQGCNVYAIPEDDHTVYLLNILAISASGNRYFRAWTADRLDGEWTELATTEKNAFATPFNVTGGDWALDGIVQGEMLRDNPDETMTINTCNMRYLYQGLVAEGAVFSQNVYSLGLLTDARD